MKLLLIITLLMTSIFASEIKTIRYKFMQDAYVGNNHMIPQTGTIPKKKDTFTFILTNGNEKDRIIDHKNKKVWMIGHNRPTNLFYMERYRNYCGDPVDTNTLKTIDLNLVHYILKDRNKENKDISIFVKAKEGKNWDPYNYKVFSITQNKYIDFKNLNTPYESYSVCEKNYKSSMKFYNRLLGIDKRYNEAKQKEEQQEKINVKKRKTIQVADDADQGMILQIKGPLVLIQKKTCTIMNEYGTCLSYGKTTEWVKRKELTFKNQK